MKRNLVVDLLYIEGGSLNEDSNAVIAMLSPFSETSYFRKGVKRPLKAIFELYAFVFFNPCDSIIVLSAKISQLYLLLPLRIFHKVFFVYHFIPRTRFGFHMFSLNIFRYFFKIGVYSKILSNFICESSGVSPVYIPSRYVDKSEAAFFLNSKIKSDTCKVFVPGIRSGVRNNVDLCELLQTVSSIGRYAIEEIIIQDYKKNSYILNGVKITHVGQLSDNDFHEYYKQSLFCFVNFVPEYEVRASGILLDAIAFGCIVVGEEHPILKEYGYPDSTVTTPSGILKLLDIITEHNCKDFFKVSDYQEGVDLWRTFLN